MDNQTVLETGAAPDNPASVQAGEVAFDTGIGEEERPRNPLQVIGDGARTLFSNVIGTFKNPMSLIPAGVIAVLWIVLTALRAGGINPAPVGALSFLSFADAGVGGGVVKTLGGLVGKGVFVAAVYRVIGMFTKKEKGEKRGLADTLRGAFAFDLADLWSWTLGLGFGLIALAFISGGLHRYSLIGGIAGAFMAAKSALDGGFVSQLAGSVTRMLGGKGDGGGFTRGLASGMGLGGLLALINIPIAVMIIGAVLVAGSVVMMILDKLGIFVLGGKKEEAKAE